MQSKRLLILKLLLVTVAAAVTIYYAVATLKTKAIGLTDNGFSFVENTYPNDYKYKPPTLITNNVDFINKNYPYHLVSPTWMPNIRDQMLIWDWLKTEKETRIGVIAVLWLASSSFIVWHNLRNQRKP
jgi:hypothetical protein